MTPPDLSHELEALRTRLAEVEREQAEQRLNRRTRRMRVTGVAVVGAIIAGTAYAANGNCPNGMPVCFAQNTPAKAVDVNLDFAQLKEWVETKVGAVTSSSITTTAGVTVNGGGLTVNGGDLHVATGRIHGSDTVGDTHVYTTGNGYLYLNYYGGNSVAFGDGAQHIVGRMDNQGFLNLNNYVYSQNAGHRAPSVAIANNCNSGSCSQSCPSGTTIKMAFGFHGANWNANSGAWGCGSAFQWIGSCIGQSSCQVVTGCGSSSIWLECW